MIGGVGLSDEVVGWLDDRLAAASITRIGEVTVPRVRPWSTVCTAPTTEGPVWLKIPGPLSRYEVPLYEILTRVVPDQVPHAIAVDTERGRLLLADGGTSLRDEMIDEMVTVLPAYGRLQRKLTPHVDDLLAAGVPDMRAQRMPDRFDEAVAAVARRVERDDDHETVRRVAAMRETFAAWCERLAASPAPVSLDHNDLHAGNVLAGAPDAPGGRMRIYDWGDSVVAHPFTSMLVALDRLPGSVVPRARDAYLGAFADLAPHAELVTVLGVARRVAMVARVLTWERALDHGNSDVTRRFARAPLETLASLLG